VAHIKFATVTSGSLPATAFPIRESGIGNSNRSCVPVPPATLPCQIGIGDVATSGTNIALTATYTLVPPDPNTTTTTTTTTTAAPTTTAPPTTAPPTTTPATIPPASVAGGSGGTGTPGAGAVEVVPAPAPAAATSKPALASTGMGTASWWALGIGIALLDLGYLAISSTWPKRGRLFHRAH
jgi:hypothetical protein